MTYWMDETETGLAPIYQDLGMQPESFIGLGELEYLISWLLALGIGAAVLRLLVVYGKRVNIDNVSDESIFPLEFFGVNTPQRRIFSLISLISAIFSTLVYVWIFQPLHYQPASKLISAAEDGRYSVATHSYGEPCPAGVFADDWTVYCIDESLAKKSEQDFLKQKEAKGSLVDFRQDRFAKTYYVYRFVDIIVYAILVLSVPFAFVAALAICFQFCVLVVSSFEYFLTWLTRFIGWVKTGRF